jgi:hypothetical protein
MLKSHSSRIPHTYSKCSYIYCITCSFTFGADIVHKAVLLGETRLSHIIQSLRGPVVCAKQLWNKFPTQIRVHAEKWSVAQLRKKIKRVCRWYLLQAKWIQSTPSHSISLKPILKLYFHLRLGLEVSRPKLYVFLISSTRCYITSPSHPP